jgi:mRNA degradation ribonuclease J1/J2
MVYIVNEIDPKTLVPIHTEEQDLFPILFGQKVRIVKGESLEI